MGFHKPVGWAGVGLGPRKPNGFMVAHSVRKRPGRPADNRGAFSLARPGQCETDLGFVGQALGKPAGFMGAWRRRQAFGIINVTSQYFFDVWVISPDAARYLKMAADICWFFSLGPHHLNLIIF